jgi:tetratricopeptide (TPR) repeat protein
MKFRHPLVLLLGGLLSASGIGCSAITAVVGDSRPAARQGRDSAGQMAAIARVFENQGRYGQAEVMYRKALKQNPNDPTIRTQLQQLAERRKGKNFAADPVKEAIAQADSAASARTHSPAASVAPQSKALASVGTGTNTGMAQTSSNSSTTKPTPNAPAAIVSSVLTQPSSELAEEIEAGATSAVTTAAATVNSTINHVKAVSAEIVSPAPELRSNTVTAEEILAVVDTSAEHSDLLLRGLRYGDSLEAQCLAATLMGDCDTDNAEIRKALETASHSAKDTYLRLAITDSRIQRNEHDAKTAACLISLMEDGPMDVRIQACSSLRHFAGSDSQTDCVQALAALLDTDSPDLRAAAAVTLGDFEQLSPEVVARLISIARSDASSDAREAAGAATARYEGRSPETAMTIAPLGE